jgi:hypothetical protein
MSDYGLRNDPKQGEKGKGYFGEIKSKDGKTISTEVSIGVDGEDIPSLVPTLSRSEIDSLANGGKPTREIVRKAAEHATKRRKEGKSPYASSDEAIMLMPNDENELEAGFNSVRRK